PASCGRTRAPASIRPPCFGRLGDRLPLVPTPQTRSLRGGRGASNQRSSAIIPGQHGLARPEPAVANLLCAKTGHNDTSAHKEDLLRWTGNEKGAPGGAPLTTLRSRSEDFGFFVLVEGRAVGHLGLLRR